eukprot:scaffold154839_cov40-Prasinocladus_malaysianus.AAC.1
MLDNLLRQRAAVDRCFQEKVPEAYSSMPPSPLEWSAAAQLHKVLEHVLRLAVRAEDKTHLTLADAGVTMYTGQAHTCIATWDSYRLDLDGYDCQAYIDVRQAYIDAFVDKAT